MEKGTQQVRHRRDTPLIERQILRPAYRLNGTKSDQIGVKNFNFFPASSLAEQVVLPPDRDSASRSNVTDPKPWKTTTRPTYAVPIVLNVNPTPSISIVPDGARS